MPRFIFNKLVRDKLVEEFERMGQTATYRTLTPAGHVKALKQKIIEEAKEIPANGSSNDLVSEIADVQQALDDLKSVHNITDGQVADAQRLKHEKKGGFLSGSFVQSLELDDGDEWVEYYRAHPDIFPEVQQVAATNNSIVQPGVYRHYKGKEYDVLAVGRHAETGGDYVIYRPLYDSEVKYWIRPLEMFIETVVVDGATQQRFKKIDEGHNDQ